MHSCGEEGCGKTFSRKEHLRRHQLNRKSPHISVPLTRQFELTPRYYRYTSPGMDMSHLPRILRTRGSMAPSLENQAPGRRCRQFHSDPNEGGNRKTDGQLRAQ